ncbi:hypothetical protein N7G274_001974 [Stereocaulon virgatum]|uniref:Uncharacterized protein n=1 Tax=Stereocaulon virgatum TaxID=373712 RepID=A0ABR4AL26_9LECA
MIPSTPTHQNPTDTPFSPQKPQGSSPRAPSRPNLNHELLVLQHRLTQLISAHCQTQLLTAEILSHRTHLPDIDTPETWAWRQDVIDDAVARYQGTLELREGAILRHLERISEVQEMIKGVEARIEEVEGEIEGGEDEGRG